MKTIALLLMLSLSGGVTRSQTASVVTLSFKNNGLLPREFRFLERHTANKYPNVFTAYLLPGQLHTVRLRVGTTLSLVTQAEINATMQGQVVPGKPLLVVQPDDAGKTVKLIQNQ
ncbi:hypothetical protein [Spirosoma sp. 209]|uniref:hypothetical protein n=1 Tax=Spirosoma sp. 209 TaxID=1955701 RepID=UPI00111647E6|nr:hypothetical protein [Spirosoma sp. 209]